MGRIGLCQQTIAAIESRFDVDRPPQHAGRLDVKSWLKARENYAANKSNLNICPF
jgi:hypothetical protein